MPFNYKGDLYKSEVLKKLQEKGCDIKNVHELNLILEKMGLLIHSGKRWLTSDEGVKYTIYSSRVFDANAWHPAIVDVVYKYLKK